VQEVLLFNKFFRLSICALVAKIWPDKVVRWCRDGDFLRPVFSASRVQYISDLHSNFALWPVATPCVELCGGMVDIQSTTAEIRRGKKKIERRNHGKNIMSASATQGGHN